MNTDIIQGKWEQVKGDVSRQWGKLTDNILMEINGSRTKLLGKIQENYGIARDEAEAQVAKWEKDRAA
jgi:uncharacterized protein YjbJ (UPF0337 family)